MCNLYSLSKGQDAIRRLLDEEGGLADRTGNLAPLRGIFPDTRAPIVRRDPKEGGRELVLGRWGMPSPAFVLKGRKTDPGVTNIRNTASPHWRRWLGPAHRCLVRLRRSRSTRVGAAGRSPCGPRSAMVAPWPSSPGSGWSGPASGR